jgi:hypothetical protein
MKTFEKALMLNYNNREDGGYIVKFQARNEKGVIIEYSAILEGYMHFSGYIYSKNDSVEVAKPKILKIEIDDESNEKWFITSIIDSKNSVKYSDQSRQVLEAIL